MIIYIALCIIGVHAVVDSLLFTFTGKDLDVYYDILGDRSKYLKPLIFCTLCMSSVWGFGLQLTYDTPLMFITNVFAVAGVIELINRFLK